MVAKCVSQAPSPAHLRKQLPGWFCFNCWEAEGTPAKQGRAQERINFSRGEREPQTPALLFLFTFAFRRSIELWA